MKLKKLIIHNIASIEDAEIDFEKSPLSDSEVFLITGKTGAGKSTILDSICLALYANSPRFDNTGMKEKDIEDKELTTDNPRLFIRERTGECFTELTFTGNNGRDYTARWSVARAHKKPTGKLQDVKWSLTDNSTGVALTKQKQISNEIARIVGLDFQQFCRTTMLAQGEFARFLNSDYKEKAEILEKITGVDIYSKIGAKIYEISQQKKADWERAELARDGIKLLSDDELNEKKREIDSIESLYNETKDAKTKQSAKLEWLLTREKLAGELEQNVKQSEEAKNIAESDETKRDIRLVDDWNATITVRGHLQRRLDDERQLEEALHDLALGKNDYLDFLRGLRYLEITIEKVNGEILEIQKWIEGQKPRSKTYDKESDILFMLKSFADNRRRIEDETKRVISNEIELDDVLKPRFIKETAITENLQKEFDRLKVTGDLKETEYKKTGLPDLRTKQREAESLIAEIKIALQKWALLNDRLIHLKSREKQAAQTAEDKKRLEEMTITLESAVTKARGDRDDALKIYQSHQRSVNDYAKVMRASLTVGDDCPVCGNHIRKAFKPEEELQKIVDVFKQKSIEADSAFNESQSLLAENQAAINQYNKSIEELIKEIESSRVFIGNKETELRSACKKIGIEYSSDSVEANLKAKEEQLTTLCGDYRQRIAKAESLGKEVDSLRQQLEKKRVELEDAKKKIQSTKDAVTKNEYEITSARNAIWQLKERNTLLEKELQGAVSGEWLTDWNKNPETFATELKEAVRMFELKMNRLGELRLTVSNYESQCVTFNDNNDSILTLMPHWMNHEPIAPMKVDNLSRKATDLISKLGSLKSTIGNLNRQIESSKAFINSFLMQHPDISTDRLLHLNQLSPDSISEITSRLKAIELNRVSKEAACRQTENRIAEHLLKKPEFNVDDTKQILAALLTEADRKMQSLSERKGTLMAILEADKTNRIYMEGIIKDIEEKKAIFDSWSRLDKLLGDKNGEKFKKIAQSFVLKNLIDNANYYMNTLSGRYTLRTSPGSFVISVDDAYQGFANRAATTLSGGETFLVSLSLALALSDIGRRLGVDTLFIDEGFGTLSGEPLRKAIDTLRSLHDKTGKHVGIISHVEELQESIPVQIRVQQDAKSSSSTVHITPC